MPDPNWLAEQFEQNRGHLRAVAYRMLGSAAEADDAVQEAWLRLSGCDSGSIQNLGAWLTTVVARICLDLLRSRSSRREEGLETQEPAAAREPATDPEREAVLADSVGVALMVVLDRLAPAERIAFVLHDLFGLPFEEIGSIVGRSPAAARQLASRARRRVQGSDTPAPGDMAAHREVVKSFLGALRAGDVQGLIAVLDPDVVVRVDEAAARPGAPREVRGAATWAKGAVAFAALARGAVEPMLINGQPGLVWAPGGRPTRVLTFSFKDGRIAGAEVIASPARLKDLQITVMPA